MALLPHQEQETGLVPLKSAPLPMLPKQHYQRRKGIFRTIGAFFGLVRDYTAEDIGRLVEAEISKREGEAAKAHAEAEANVALAAERHATAELRRSEATVNLAAAQDAASKAAERSRQAEIDDAYALSDAVERVELVISRIKMQGGAVFFDKLQLTALLRQAQTEFPEDKLIQDSCPADETGDTE